MKNYNNREIMMASWRLVRENKFPMSDALRNAWENAKLKKKMLKSVAFFEFRKKDGTIREAYGTLNSQWLPATTGSERAKSDSVQVFYDVIKGAWRSYIKANLIF